MLHDSIRDDTLQQEFSDFVRYIDDPICDKGEVSLPDIIIPQLNNNGADHDSHSHSPLSFPLSESIISKIEPIAQPSPFGQNTKTIIDDKIRKGFELETKQFYFQDCTSKNQIKSFNSRDDEFVEQVRLRLASHVPYIECKAYKLMFYQKGGFFKSHVDTMRENGHFATLLVSIPFVHSHKGGDLILTYKKRTVYWNPNQQHDSNDKYNCNGLKFKYIAFYSDISHKVTMVETGIRVTLSFNLIIPSEIMLNYEHHLLSNQSNLFQHNNPNPNNLSLKHFQLRMTNVLKESYLVKTLDVPDPIINIIAQFSGHHPVLHRILDKISFVNKNGDDEKEDEKEEKTRAQDGLCIIFAHRYATRSGTRRMSDKPNNHSKKKYGNNHNNNVDPHSDDLDINKRFGRKKKKHAKVLNPLILKGCDSEIYQFFKKYVSTVFLTPITIKSVVGEWSDEYDNENEAQQNGRYLFLSYVFFLLTQYTTHPKNMKHKTKTETQTQQKQTIHRLCRASD